MELNADLEVSVKRQEMVNKLACAFSTAITQGFYLLTHNILHTDTEPEITIFPGNTLPPKIFKSVPNSKVPNTSFAAYSHFAYTVSGWNWIKVLHDSGKLGSLIARVRSSYHLLLCGPERARYRARQLYKNISMLFLFPVTRDLLFTNI